MKVNLVYFRFESNIGKYYSEGNYITEKENLWEIRDDVDGMLEARNLPGLVQGHSLYYVFVDVPEHPHNHPFLVVPFWYDKVEE